MQENVDGWKAFQSNLRGMETSLEKGRDDPFLFVSIESKRNGNRGTGGRICFERIRVSIESKRNGNTPARNK